VLRLLLIDFDQRTDAAIELVTITASSAAVINGRLMC
jgi:hypothetical protein